MTIYHPTLDYYVYAYLREDGTPYYIGKGKDKRAYSSHHRVPVPQDTFRIVFLETNLTNVGALALERQYIRWYGRKDQNTGILRNMTDGGDGIAGIKGCIRTEQFKENLSKNRQGKNNPFFGKTHSPKVRLSMIQKRTGKKITQPRFCCEHCGIETIRSNLVRWHGDKCKLKVAFANL
jgi:hypothetical protein